MQCEFESEQYDTVQYDFVKGGGAAPARVCMEYGEVTMT